MNSIEDLNEFLNKLTISSSDGMIAEVDKVGFKPFFLPNQGGLAGSEEKAIKDIKSLVSQGGRNKTKTSLTVPLGLNFQDEITEAGGYLLDPCRDRKQLIMNQIKKWRFPSITYQKKVTQDCYPYWIILEVLFKLKKEKNIDFVTTYEFIILIATIKKREFIDDHINAILCHRSVDCPYNVKPEKNDETPLARLKNRYGGDSWQGVFRFCEFINVGEDIIELSDVLDMKIIEKNINDFYKDFTLVTFEPSNKKTHHVYTDFLHSIIKDSPLFPTDQPISSDHILSAASKLIKVKPNQQSQVENNEKYRFPYKNLLLKGVPGTGKSRLIDEIIKNNIFKLENENDDFECYSIKDMKENNVLRINIHAATNNSELMQGIGVRTNSTSQIEYSEKQGLILDHIVKAIFQPALPFVIILEEVQENNLNRLIGDLIFLIEDSRRAKFNKDDNEYIDGYVESDKVNERVKKKEKGDTVLLPSLIEKNSSMTLCIPENLYFFCTSNYRDDRKIMEDNLLRRFEVIEVYPDSNGPFTGKNTKVQKFFEELNKNIVKQFSGETHPDRFEVGHANWMDVANAPDFSSALCQLIVDFKDVKEETWECFSKILSASSPFNNGELDKSSYQELTKILQSYYFPYLDISTSTEKSELIINSIEAMFSEKGSDESNTPLHDSTTERS
jgi:hypothetical protein